MSMNDSIYLEYLQAIFPYLRNNPEQRVGQAAMNVLYEFDVVLYRHVRDSELNPFFDDTKLMKFFEHVQPLLDNGYKP